ncbi:MAG: DUF262 domain-containing protein [Selenomonadaceae bacterium]|nr:DUF262 domain-containing protein [Selenomonadaceae bacterium]MBQ3726669.1 DUF262 domain-containing protein [Selenomonadaceae bacterium]
MAGWETKTVDEVITKIRSKKFVLPVIQRRLVWKEDAMTKLFDTLLKGYSFGAVIVLKERSGFQPLFASREFSDDGEPRNADLSTQEKFLDDEQFFVIDGQQRLQSFYIGLCGSFGGKKMHFDLYSDFQKGDYDFKFARPTQGKSSVKNIERGERTLGDSEIETTAECFWYPVRELYEKLSRVGGNSGRIADEIISEQNIDEPHKIKHIEENIKQFYGNIFERKNVGISEVEVDYGRNEIENRQRMVELFRRLNSGGTYLSTLDLVASRLKGFDSRMENFLDAMVSDCSDIRISQDELIKLIMTLQDKPLSEITDLDEDGEKFAAFALENSTRIKSTLVALREFLRKAGDYNWFALNRSRSPIPLYVLSYHIFYAEHADENFQAMRRWLRLSMLNGIFRRGCGWIPSERGMKLLHDAFKNFHGQPFPVDALFDVCKKNLHSFYSEVKPGNLDDFDRNRDYMFYLIYDGAPLSSGAVDHIQPRARLLGQIGRGQKNITEEMIDSIANLELLTREDNAAKSDKRLKDWLNRQADRQKYLERHLIPDNEGLWKPSNFKQFLKARAEKISAKINASMR